MQHNNQGRGGLNFLPFDWSGEKVKKMIVEYSVLSLIDDFFQNQNILGVINILPRGTISGNTADGYDGGIVA